MCMFWGVPSGNLRVSNPPGQCYGKSNCTSCLRKEALRTPKRSALKLATQFDEVVDRVRMYVMRQYRNSSPRDLSSADDSLCKV